MHGGLETQGFREILRLELDDGRSRHESVGAKRCGVGCSDSAEVNDAFDDCPDGARQSGTTGAMSHALAADSALLGGKFQGYERCRAAAADGRRHLHNMMNDLDLASGVNAQDTHVGRVRRDAAQDGARSRGAGGIGAEQSVDGLELVPHAVGVGGFVAERIAEGARTRSGGGGGLLVEHDDSYSAWLERMRRANSGVKLYYFR